MTKHLAFCLGALTTLAWAQPPENITVDGVPPISPTVRREAGRYLEFRAASFQSWHPTERQMLITTRFAEASQLHRVTMPGGAREQLTFLPEPVLGGSFQPKQGRCLVFSQDVGGGEFYQLYRYDLAEGKITLLTDGQSRNTGPRWSRNGQWLAYTSTRRNGRDTDVYVMDPAQPASDRLLCELSGGGWRVEDWSPDHTTLLLQEYLSINESRLHRVEVKTGQREQLLGEATPKAAYRHPRFGKDTRTIFYTTDHESEFHRLVRRDLQTGTTRVLSGQLNWDVEEFEVSPDGQQLVFITNEDGVGRLHLIDAESGRERRLPKVPVGVAAGLAWHENSREFGFHLTAAQSPMDAYSIDLRADQLVRWTKSETGGLPTSNFVEPQFFRVKSFDGLEVSAFVYRPDAKKFPGKRPVIVLIHGGPESQARPGFQARYNYFLNELGIAIVYPNVRGSSGYGKTFLTRDNGFQREDSVRDIGAVIRWIQQDAGLDASRIGVMGGSYGGYMVLASLMHFGDQLRCGVDVVGISNFLTFLKNTQDYRRDLRRVEYGDERDEAMRAFLERISPTQNVARIKKPLLVVQGKNDPRVPLSESEQMVKAIREQGGTVWYLMAQDEGHGFAKKKNADYQFLATVMFLEQYLLAQ